MADDSLYTDTLFPGVAVITGAAGTGQTIRASKLDLLIVSQALAQL